MRRHLTAVVGAGLLALGLSLGGPAVLPLGSTADAAPGRCEPGDGVTVVVDFGGLGGGVPIGCDPSGGGKPANQVTEAAGFDITYVNGQPFVCRLDGKPTTEQESCQRTPPADAYWGLFWSDGKSGWTYSSQGVASLQVPEGGSIGFRWQDGGDREQPGAAPTPAPAPEPKQTSTPKPEPKPEPKHTSSGPAPTPAAGGGGTSEAPEEAAAGSASADPSPSKRPRKPRERPSDSPSPSGSASEEGDDPTDGPDDGELTAAAPVAEEAAAGTGAGPVWLAALLALGLGGAVVATLLRRRRS